MRLLAGLALFSLLGAQQVAETPSAVPPRAEPPGKQGLPKEKNKNGLARQRVAIRRQIGEPDAKDWFFWNWPKREAETPAETLGQQ